MNTKVIKQKMKSVGNIKKITRTMEMVSVAKMKRATIAAHAYRPFIRSTRHILTTLYNDKHTQHKLLKNKNIIEFSKDINVKKESENIGQTIVILMAANKGLCGGYNAQVYKALNKNIKAIDKSKISFITIGKYAERIAKRYGSNIIYSFAKNNINNREASIIAKEVIKRYTDNNNIVEKVLLIHPYIKSGMSYSVSVEQILPHREFIPSPALPNGMGATSNSNASAFFPSPNLGEGGSKRSELTGEGSVRPASNFKYEPNESTIVETIVPIMIEAMIHAAALETEAGEHAARMVAMKTATDNAGDLLHDLKLTFNNARQAKITQEIAELSSVI